jgi:hypothetical protein
LVPIVFIGPVVFFRRLKTDNPLFDTFGFGLLASFDTVAIGSKFDKNVQWMIL